MFTNCIKLSARYATQAIPIANNTPKHCKYFSSIYGLNFTGFIFFMFLLYKSIVVVVANAFNSLAVDDIAALKITAINKPIKPFR